MTQPYKKGSKWYSYVVISGRRTHLGSYTTEEKALEVLDAAESNMEKLQDFIDSKKLDITLWELMCG